MPKSCLIRNVLECFIFYWIFLPFLTIFHMLYKMKYEIWSEISAACYWLNSEHSHKRFTILDLSQLIWTFLYINVCIIISVAWPQGITLKKSIEIALIDCVLTAEQCLSFLLATLVPCILAMIYPDHFLLRAMGTLIKPIWSSYITFCCKRSCFLLSSPGLLSTEVVI